MTPMIDINLARPCEQSLSIPLSKIRILMKTELALLHVLSLRFQSSFWIRKGSMGNDA